MEVHNKLFILFHLSICHSCTNVKYLNIDLPVLQLSVEYDVYTELENETMYGWLGAFHMKLKMLVLFIVKFYWIFHKLFCGGQNHMLDHKSISLGPKYKAAYVKSVLWSSLLGFMSPYHIMATYLECLHLAATHALTVSRQKLLWFP